MATINLLPWRERRRHRRRREFFIALSVAALVGLFIIGAAEFMLGAQTREQRQRNADMQRQIKALDVQLREIQKLQQQNENLQQRLQAIQKLQQKRPQAVRVLEQLARLLPDGVVYTELSEQGGRLNIAGVAASSQGVADLMRRLEADPRFSGPGLEAVREQPELGAGAAAFNMQVALVDCAGAEVACDLVVIPAPKPAPAKAGAGIHTGRAQRGAGQ